MVMKTWREKLIESFLECEPLNKDQFLIVKETLTRVGDGDLETKTLSQLAYILHKKGKYYLCHYKQLQQLDDGLERMLDDDVFKLNAIAVLMEKWNILRIIKNGEAFGFLDKTLVTVKHSEKSDWTFISPYSVGDTSKGKSVNAS